MRLNNTVSLRGLSVLLLLLIWTVSANAQRKNTLLVTTDGRISFTASNAWVAVGSADPKIKKLLQKVLEKNPGFKQFMNQPGNKFTLAAFDTSDSTADRFMDNMNVVVQSAQGASQSDLPQIGAQMKQALNGQGEIAYEVVNLPTGKALRYWGSMRFIGPQNQTVASQFLAYALIHKGNIYFITFSTLKGQMDKKKAGFEKVMKSIRLK